MTRADSPRTRAELDERLALVLAGLLVSAFRAEPSAAERVPAADRREPDSQRSGVSEQKPEAA